MADMTPPQNDLNKSVKPKVIPINAVHITEDDMRDDDSEQIVVAKKIPLVKQRKESVDNLNNQQDRINVKLIEAKHIHTVNNDLVGMDFDEAYNHLDNKLSNLIDNDFKDNEPNCNKNILDDDEESKDELK